MSADKILFAYVVLLLGVLTAFAVYTEVRRRRFRPEPTEDRLSNDYQRSIGLALAQAFSTPFPECRETGSAFRDQDAAG